MNLNLLTPPDRDPKRDDQWAQVVKETLRVRHWGLVEACHSYTLFSHRIRHCLWFNWCWASSLEETAGTVLLLGLWSCLWRLILSSRTFVFQQSSQPVMLHPKPCHLSDVQLFNTDRGPVLRYFPMSENNQQIPQLSSLAWSRLCTLVLDKNLGRSLYMLTVL